MPVETTRQLADALLVALEAVAVEHRERDEREGIVRLANELLERLELFTPEHRERAASRVVASLCAVCHERRKAKALAMRKWRAKRHKVMTA